MRFSASSGRTRVEYPPKGGATLGSAPAGVSAKPCTLAFWLPRGPPLRVAEAARAALASGFGQDDLLVSRILVLSQREGGCSFNLSKGAEWGESCKLAPSGAPRVSEAHLCRCPKRKHTGAGTMIHASGLAGMLRGYREYLLLFYKLFSSLRSHPFGCTKGVAFSAVKSSSLPPCSHPWCTRRGAVVNILFGGRTRTSSGVRSGRSAPTED